MQNSATTPQPALPSDRRFGILFAGVAGAAAAYGTVRGWPTGATVAAVFAAFVFGCLALVAPSVLHPLNQLWFRLGIALGKIVNPIVMGVIFFVLLTPVAFLTRIAGRDVLKLRKRTAISHWVDRAPPGPPGDSFKNMF